MMICQTVTQCRHWNGRQSQEASHRHLGQLRMTFTQAVSKGCRGILLPGKESCPCIIRVGKDSAGLRSWPFCYPEIQSGVIMLLSRTASAESDTDAWLTCSRVLGPTFYQSCNYSQGLWYCWKSGWGIKEWVRTAGKVAENGEILLEKKFDNFRTLREKHC